LAATAAAATVAAGFTPTKDDNMNGEYHISQTPNAPGNFSTNFKDYPGGVEYFEVYHGPINSTSVAGLGCSCFESDFHNSILVFSLRFSAHAPLALMTI
jgi:hypothetical protein